MSLCAEGENSQCFITTGVSREVWNWGIILVLFVVISALYMYIDYLLYKCKIKAKSKNN